MLLYLPIEILEIIFIYSHSLNLPLVNHIFYRISQSSRIRSRLIAHKYKDQVFKECWKIGFMHKLCSCLSNHTGAVCVQEEYQLNILIQILQVSELGNQEDALIHAAFHGHLGIVEYFIKHGTSTNVKVKYKDWFKRSKSLSRKVSLLEKGN